MSNLGRLSIIHGLGGLSKDKVAFRIRHVLGLHKGLRRWIDWAKGRLLWWAKSSARRISLEWQIAGGNS